MRLTGIIATLAVVLAQSGTAQTIYFNDFSDPNSLQQFTVVGESFIGYNPGPLHTVSLANQQAQITTTAAFPNGPLNSPVLLGSAFLMRGNSDFGSGFSDVLSQNSSTISWTFNVANSDGQFNNEFAFILGSTLQNPNSLGAQGYCLRGGGLVGNRMTLTRFNNGTGNQDIIVDVPDGLGTLPEMGSFKITFDPTTSLWQVFESTGSTFSDPMQVSTLIGSGVDSAYANTALPYFGFGGETTGTDLFDNVGVTLVPEPAPLVLAGLGGLSLLCLRRRK